MKNWIATVIFAAGMLGVATQLSARPGSGMESMEPLDRIERITEHLDLSVEQEEEINRLIDEVQIASAVDRERLHQIREDLRALSADFDDGEAQSLTDELGQISGRIAYRNVSTMAAVRALFTTEQLQQIEEYREHRNELRGQQGAQQGGQRRDMFGG
jgi:Spy/CpxP family protein refolding chaperone